MPRNLKAKLAYDGTDFNGWQIQPQCPTVQGAVADAIERVTGERILPQGSGRTDAGVHALAQVASFALESPIPCENLITALNHTLPASIRITEVVEVPHGFHARHSAKAKTYEYRIFRGGVCPPFIARYVHHHPYPLDEEQIREAASYVIGEHDFSSFAAADPEKGKEGFDVDQVRSIFSSDWQRDGDLLTYRVRGNGFLHHMVRNLVGTFLLVGKGSIAAASIPSILASRERSLAGPTAPASGLFLISVEY
jgi:tRNA pseudouridine38-40 synthase